MMRSARIFYFLFSFVMLGLFGFADPAYSSPATMTYQARIVKPNGDPLEDAGVYFKLYYTDTTGSCVLYSEEFTSVNMNGSGGRVVLQMGNGTKLYPLSSAGLFDILNYGQPQACQGGGSVTPGAADRRKIILVFNDGSGLQTLPAVALNSVPYSLHANLAMNANQLGGLSSADYTKKSELVTCSAGQALRYNGSIFVCESISASLSQASATTSGFLASSDWSVFNSKQNALGFAPLNPSNNLSDLTNASTARSNLGLGTAAVLNTGTASGNIPVLDGSGKLPSSVLPAPVSADITASLGFVPVASVAGRTGAVVLSSSDISGLTVGTSAGTLAAGNDSRIVNAFQTSSSLSGDVTGTPSAVSVNRIKGIAVNAASPSSGDVLRFDGSEYVPAAIPSSAVSSVAGRTGAVVLSSSDISGLIFGTSAGTFAAGNDSRFTDARVPSGAASGDLSGTYPNPVLANVVTAGTSSKVTFDAKGRIVSSASLVSTDITGPLGFIPVTTVAGRTGAVTLTSADISGLAVGTSAGTLAAGNDSRIVNAFQTSSSLSGDVTGTPSAVSVNRIKGIAVNASAPSSGDVLRFDGSEYIPAAIPSAPVSSVAGRTGAIVLSSSDVSGLAFGTSAGTFAQGNDSRFTDSRTPSGAASGDLSGTYPNPVLANVVTAGTSSKVTFDAKGRIVSSAALVSTDITGPLGFIPVTTVAGRTGAVTLTSADISGLNVGTSAGTLAAGNDSRIVNAFQTSSSLSGDVTGTPSNVSVEKIRGIGVSASAPASGDVLIYNGSQYVLAAIPSAPVSSVAGRTGAVALSSSDISGLAFGTSAGTFAQGNDSRFTDSRSPSGAASGDLSGTYPNPVLANVVTAGTSSKVTFDAKGRIISSASLVSTDITGPLGFIPVTTVAGRTGNVALTSADISGLTVGTSAGTLAAGNDSRIVNAFQTSSSLSGDVTGTPSAVSVNRIKGIAVNAAAPSSGDVLRFDGTEYVPASIPAAPVSSVAGRTGAVVLSSSDISGLTIGTSAGTFAAGNDSRFTDSRSPSGAASGDLSGTYPNPVLANVVTAGTSSKVTFDAKGRIVSAASLVSTDITDPLGFIPVTTVAGRTGAVVLTSADISGLTVGTSAGTLAAGNDSRIVNAFQTSSSLSGDVTGTPSAVSVNRIKGIAVNAAAPSSGDVLRFDGTEYVPAAIPAAPVSSVAGRTGAVALSSADISGLTIGTSAGTFAAGNDSRFTDARTPSGAASGDLSGTYPNPVLANVVTAGTSSKVTFDAKGRIISSAALLSTDITSALTFTPGDFKADGSVAMTGALRVGAAGAASAPALKMDGTWYAGGTSTTTKPQFLIEPSSGVTSNNWSTGGTAIGVNASSDFTGNLIDLQTNGTSYFSVNGNGFINASIIGLNRWDNTAYSSSTATGGYPGAVIGYFSNTNQESGTAMSLLLSSRNTDANSQRAYVGTVSTSGSSEYTPALVFGQQSGADGYTERMRISPAGNVGIGTSSPSVKLDVNGTLNATAITVNGSPLVAGVSSVAGRSGAVVLSSSDISGLTIGTSAGSFAAGNDSRFTDARTPSGAASGDLTGSYPNPGVAKLRGVPVSATSPTSSGQVLRYDGSQWLPNFVAITDLRSTVTGSSQFGAACGSGQTLTYNVVGDVMSCQNIVVDGSNFSSQTAKTFLAAPSGSAGAPSFRTIAGADLPNPSSSTLGGVQSAAAVSHQWISSISTSGVPALSQPAFSDVAGSADLTTQVTGTLPVGSGGTGVTSLPATFVLNGAQAGAVILGTSNATDLTLRTSGSPRMTVLSGGNVGIGTASPGRLLHVAGPMRIAASSLPGSPATGDIAIDSGASNALKWYNGSTWVSAGGGAGSYLPLTGGNLTGTTNVSLTPAAGGNLLGFSANISADQTNTNVRAIQANIVGDPYDAVYSNTYGADINIATGNSTNIYGVSSVVSTYAGSYNNKVYGGYFKVTGAGGASSNTNGYGVYIDTVQSANPYGLYQADTTAKNYFGGKLGVGTNNPGVQLEVNGNTTITGTGGSLAMIPNNTPNASTVLLGTLTGNSSAGPQLRFTGPGSGFMDIGQNSSGDFTVEGSDTPRLVIQNTGNTGIGTSSPNDLLDVNGTIIAESTGASSKIKYGFVAGAPAGSYGSSGYNAVPTTTANTWKYGAADYASWIQYYGGGFNFYTAGSGSAGATISPTKMMSIQQNGAVGIGVSGSAAERLDVRRADDSSGTAITFGSQTYHMGQLGEDTSPNKVFIGNSYPSLSYIDFRIGGVAAANSKFIIGIDGNATLTGSLTQSSDARLKENVKVIPDSLKKLDDIRGVTFNWIDKGRDPRLQIGLIAQDVEKVFPEAVREDKETGRKSVNYSGLIAPVIEAVKELHGWLLRLEEKISSHETALAELQGQVAEANRRVASVEERANKLEAENASLKSQNDAVKARLERIEKALENK